MRRILDRTLFVPVAAVRPYLALKLTLLLLAFDMWLTRIEHGGRYGAGGFNVAHFAWLDQMQPDVSPAIYVGVCVLTGALAFTLAIASRPPRWLLALVFLLHTWSWAMSMLDSYQHHYLLSLVLLAMIFFPSLDAESALLSGGAPAPTPSPKETKRSKKKKRRGAADDRADAGPASPWSRAVLAGAPLISAWSWVLLAGSVAIVYAYTAYSKSDPEWLSGAALRSVVHLPENGVPRAGALDPIGPVRGVLEFLGIEGEALWRTMGRSVVLVQIICCVGYLLAPFRDVTKNLALRVTAWVALFTALSFHLGAEYMNLKIGWFSWYMVGYAAIFFLPGHWLVVAARVLVPMPLGKLGREVTTLRMGLGVGVLLLGATAASWTELSIFGVTLSGIFGEGWNLPLVVLGGAILGLTPVRMLARAAMDAKTDLTEWRRGALGAVALGAAAMLAVGYYVDLPGATVAGVLAAVALGAGVIGSLVFTEDPRRLHGYGVGAIFAALALLVCITQSTVRWDFYRNVGGDHRRRGEPREAYVAYMKATRYAPEGESRQEQADEMRRLIEQERR